MATGTDSVVTVVNQPSGNSNIDVSQITQDGGTIAERQRVINADPIAADALAGVTNVDPVKTSYALTVRDPATAEIRDNQYIQELQSQYPFEFFGVGTITEYQMRAMINSMEVLK